MQISNVAITEMALVNPQDQVGVFGVWTGEVSFGGVRVKFRIERQVGAAPRSVAHIFLVELYMFSGVSQRQVDFAKARILEALDRQGG